MISYKVQKAIILTKCCLRNVVVQFSAVFSLFLPEMIFASCECSIEFDSRCAQTINGIETCSTRLNE